MNWAHAWIASLVWIGEAYGLALAGSVVAMLAATRYTHWGRQFARLAWPYFTPRRSPKPLLALALVLLLSIAAVRMQVLFSLWYNGFYDSLQALDAPAFWAAIRLFGILATVHIARVLVAYLVSQAFDIRWRVWLNQHLTEDWLAGRAYYRTRFLDSPGDNPDQRIQVDIDSFVTTSRTLAIGCVNALVSLVEFSVMLWGLSGALSVAGIEVPRAMVMLVYLYVLVASVVAFKLGRPLIRLSFMNEKLSGDFRYALIRVREYAENIAFYRGEGVERAGLATRFAAVIANAWAMVFRSMKFDGFNLIVTQGATVFPFLMQAPRFFSGAIKLGDVMQTAQAFGQVQDALSFFRLSYDSFAQYRAVLDRLTGFVEANAAARALPGVELAPRPDALEIVDLCTERPGGETLLRDLNLTLHPGQSLLIQGASGVGKTTLLRALAGLWPHAHGQVHAPSGHEALFLPQQPYLPLGSLRAALAYPGAEVDPEAARSALAQVQLGHLAGRLNDTADWSRMLSLGEQQRLAFARVLLNRPRIVFLDEATSAMDEGLEDAMYRLLASSLPECMLVSVGHRSTLNAFHSHRLNLRGEARWDLRSAQAVAAFR